MFARKMYEQIVFLTRSSNADVVPVGTVPSTLGCLEVIVAGSLGLIEHLNCAVGQITLGLLDGKHIAEAAPQ